MNNYPFGKQQTNRFKLVIKSVARRNSLSLVFNAKYYSHITNALTLEPTLGSHPI